MRRLALIAIVFLLVPAAAHAQRGYQVRVNGGGFFTSPQTPQVQLGPWYLYWPLEAHFQTPAPPAYPYWPQGGGNSQAAAGYGPPGPGNFGPGGPGGYGYAGPGNFAPAAPTGPTSYPAGGMGPVSPGATIPSGPGPNTWAPPGPGYFQGGQTLPVGYQYQVPYYWYGR